MQRFFKAGLCLLLTACVPAQLPVTGGASPSVTEPTASVGPQSPTSTPSAAPVSPNGPGVTASASPALPTEGPAQGTAQGLAQASKLVLSLGNRFFSAVGEQRELRIEVQDAQGRVLPTDGLTFAYSSSRPQDFSVDATGRVVAEVSDGYSDISVQLVGSALRVSQLVSVSSAGASSGGGGGGGGGAAAPTEENVNGQVEFQF